MRIRSAMLAIVAIASLSPVAQAAIVTVTGDTTGGPTYNRPVEDLSGASGVGTSVRYSTYQFIVSVSGDYSFLTTAAFDSFTTLYGTGLSAFNPTDPLTNAIIANDDLLGVTTSGFEANSLVAGSIYTYVVTGFSNIDFGAHSTTIGGPGTASAVPLPAAAWLLLSGLGAMGALSRRRKRLQ